MAGRAYGARVREQLELPVVASSVSIPCFLGKNCKQISRAKRCISLGGQQVVKASSVEKIKYCPLHGDQCSCPDALSQLSLCALAHCYQGLFPSFKCQNTAAQRRFHLSFISVPTKRSNQIELKNYVWNSVIKISWVGAKANRKNK